MERREGESVTEFTVRRMKVEFLKEAERVCEEVGFEFGVQEMTAVCAAGICATRIRKLIEAES